MSLNETRISMMLTILSLGDTAFQKKGCAQMLNGDIVLGTQSMPCIVPNCQSDNSYPRTLAALLLTPLQV